MGRRPKLELKPNQPTKLTLLFDDCIEGINNYGRPYALFAVESEGQEWALFASTEVAERLKPMKKGETIIVTKKAKPAGNRVIFSYNFSSPQTVTTAQVNASSGPVPISEVIPQIVPEFPEPQIMQVSTEEPASEPAPDKLFSIMRKSCIQAMELNSELNGMLNPERIAITLFIAKTKHMS